MPPSSLPNATCATTPDAPAIASLPQEARPNASAPARFWINLPSPLRQFILLLAALTLACGISESIAHRWFHYPAEDHHAYPLLWEYHPDFVYFTVKFEHLHTAEFFTTDPEHPFMYPAPVVLVYTFFYKLGGRHALQLFLAVMLARFIVATYLFARALHRRGISAAAALAFALSAAVLSYPFWFVFHQSNMEFAVWFLLSVGFLAFFHRRPYAAAICFSVAGAMKLFPFMYLGLLIARRQYRAIAVSLGVAAALTLVSLWVVLPNLSDSWHLISSGLARYPDMYMLRLRPERGFDHSLFGLYKQISPSLPDLATLGRILTAYTLIAASVGVALYVFRIRRLPVINQLLCLAIASILLPPTSFDYTLIHLYAPWVLLTFYTLDRSGDRTAQPLSPALRPALLCFAVLFAPLTELIRHGEVLAGAVRSCLLILLFGIALVWRFDDPALERSCTAPGLLPG